MDVPRGAEHEPVQVFFVKLVLLLGLPVLVWWAVESFWPAGGAARPQVAPQAVEATAGT